MKAVDAQLLSTRRASRAVWITMGALTVCALLAGGAALWQAARVGGLRQEMATLAASLQANRDTVPPQPDPVYADSARLFLRERGAAWAPALRSLEGAAMVGVTPVRVEFGAQEGNARVELEYHDATALYEYLSRLNDGLSPSQSIGRWSLSEASMEPERGSHSPSAPTGGAATSETLSMAIIESKWR